MLVYYSMLMVKLINFLGNPETECQDVAANSHINIDITQRKNHNVCRLPKMSSHITTGHTDH